MPPKKKVAAPTTAPAAVVTKAPAAPVVSRSETKGSGTATAARPAKEIARSITHQQISERAYQIYLKRGFGPGNQHTDWIEAERQLKAGL